MTKSKKQKEQEEEDEGHRQADANETYIVFNTSKGLMEFERKGIEECGDSAWSIFHYIPEACEQFKAWFEGSGLKKYQLAQAMGVCDKTASRRVNQPESIRAKEAYGLADWLERNGGHYGTYRDAVVNHQARGEDFEAMERERLYGKITERLDAVPVGQAERYTRMFIAAIDADLGC